MICTPLLIRACAKRRDVEDVCSVPPRGAHPRPRVHSGWRPGCICSPLRSHGMMLRCWLHAGRLSNSQGIWLGLSFLLSLVCVWLTMEFEDPGPGCPQGSMCCGAGALESLVKSHAGIVALLLAGAACTTWFFARLQHVNEASDVSATVVAGHLTLDQDQVLSQIYHALEDMHQRDDSESYVRLTKDLSDVLREDGGGKSRTPQPQARSQPRAKAQQLEPGGGRLARRRLDSMANKITVGVERDMQRLQVELEASKTAAMRRHKKKQEKRGTQRGNQLDRVEVVEI